MEQLRDVFAHAQTLTAQLLDKLANGVFLSGEDLMNLFGCFNQITAQQKRCLEELEQLTGISTKNCASIADLEAVLGQHLSYQKRMADARALVDAFLSVVAVDAMFCVELEKHKAPLRALDDAAILSRYESGELDIYRRFLACIESCSMEDTTPLVEPFGFQIAYGLLGGKFALDKAQIPAPAAESAPPVKREPVAEPETTAEPEVIAEPEATAESEAIVEPEATTQPESIAEPEATAESEATAQPETPAQPEPPTASLRLPESRIGVLKKEISRCKGSSALVSFIRKKSEGYFHGLSYLFELLLQSYAVDRQYCLGSKYSDGKEEQMLLAMGHMVREGVAARYTLNGDAENALYTLTAEGRRIVGNKDFQKRHLNWKYLFSPLVSDIPNAGAFLRYQYALRFYQRLVGMGDNVGASLTKYDDFYTASHTLWEEPNSPLLIFAALIFSEADDQSQMDALLGGVADLCRRAVPGAGLLAVAYADQQAAWRGILSDITGLPVYMAEPGSDLYTAADGSEHPLEDLIAAASALCAEETCAQAEPETKADEESEPVSGTTPANEAEPAIAPQPVSKAEADEESEPDKEAQPVAGRAPDAADDSMIRPEPVAQTEPAIEPAIEPAPSVSREHAAVQPIQIEPPKADDDPQSTIADPPSTEALANALASLKNPLAETEALRALLIRLLQENRFMEAIVLLKAIADTPDGEAMQPLYAALLHAVNPPMEHRDYTSAYLNEIAGYAPDPLVSWAQIGFMLWAACFPQTAYDYDLHNTIRGYCDSLQLTDLLPASAQADALTDSISHALILLCDDLAKLSFAHLDGRNFSAAVRTRLLNESMVAAHRSRLQKLASERLDTPRSSIHLPMDSFFKLTIGPASSIGQAIAAISAGAPNSAALSQRALGELAPAGEAVTDAMLQKYIDDNWNELRRQDNQLKTRRLDNGSKARNLVISELENRIQIMNEWLQLCGGPDERIAGSLQEIKSISGKVQKHFADAIAAIETLDAPGETDATARAGLQLLKGVLRRIGRILGGEEDYFADPLPYFAPLLSAGYMLLDSSDSPLLDKTLSLVPGMEPWRLMMLHIGAQKLPLEDALRCIEEPGLDPARYEDYGSARLIRRALNLPKGDYGELCAAALDDCLRLEESFLSDVRLACAYGQISEATKETVFAQLMEVRSLFLSDDKPCQGDNYAHFRMLLDALRGEIAVDHESRRRKFTADFEDSLTRLGSAPRPQMLDLIEKELLADNFAMAEEYFNRYDSGETCLPADDTASSDINFHLQFLENAEWYREQCDQPGHRGSKLRTWGSQTLRRRNFWSAGNERNADSPLDYWPIARDVAGTASDLCKFLRLLGFSVDQVTLAERAVQYEVFKAQTHPVLSGLPDYAHPVAKFGTLLQSPLNIVCLYGCKGADTLIDILAQKLQLGTTSIVLLDGALNMVERRKVAAKFKSDTSGQNAFLLIDRVLILYLSALDQGVRLNAMLQCTLPYTYDQLYTNGTGSVPDEMFIGRLSDRKKLIDINGTCLVYGGRQLGKTALLQRVTHLCHNAEQGRYALYIDIKDRGYEETVRRLRSILLATPVCGKPLIREDCHTLEEICDAIAARRDDFNQLTLFFDEADCFLEEIAPLKYTPLHPLVVLRRDALANRFKFVLAGTHNVAATANAISDNSDILQLGEPLCIEPLSMADATRLIKLPLSYLGFEIDSRRIALILANTNSYPGLIHLFCNALVTSVCDNYAEHYSVSDGNPPYQVKDEQLKAIFRQTDIKREISRRVMATIELDSKYRIVANLMAYLAYEDEEQGTPRLYGYTPAELLACNIREFKIASFLKMTADEMNALMEEMQRMGILWKQPDSPYYRFRQRDFLGYIGDSTRVTETLLEGDEGGERA